MARVLDSTPHPQKVTLIRNKVDLSAEPIEMHSNADGHVTINLCARSGDGVELLREHLKKTAWVTAKLQKAASVPVVAI